MMLIDFREGQGSARETPKALAQGLVPTFNSYHLPCHHYPFLDKHNPEQFEIVSFRKGDDSKDLSVNGKYTYMRIVIRNKRLQT